MAEDAEYDVIVVGTGISGSCAALEALEAGARVLMLDSEGEAGGSSRLSSGMIMGAGTRFQKERGIEDEPAELFRYYMDVNRSQVQPSVARRLCYEAGDTIHWLADRGVKIIDLFYSGDEKVPRGHVTEGGDAIVTALAGQMQAFDTLDTALMSRVDRLLRKDGVVCGVAVDDYEVRAASVVLATGGMGANLEMLTEWHPRSFADAAGPIRYVGLESARGDAVRLGQQIGAQVTGVGRGSRTPVGPLGGSYLPSFALVVNQLGRRYYDETSSYGLSEQLLSIQPGCVSYVILDDAIKQEMQRASDVLKYLKVLVPGSEEGLRSWTSDGIDEMLERNDIISADTLGELAFRLGIPPANLEGTIERYNSGVAAGHDPDYLKTPEGLRPIATPPFYASTVRLPLFGLTGAGLRIDHDATVLHETSRSIPGLYAAGECTGGVIGDVYVGSGNSLANCTTYGRIAGRNAAARAKEMN